MMMTMMRNVLLPDGTVRDIEIAGGRIAAILPAAPNRAD